MGPLAWQAGTRPETETMAAAAGPLAAWVVVPTTRRCVRVKVRWWVGLGGAHRQKKGLLALLLRARLSRASATPFSCLCLPALIPRATRLSNYYSTALQIRVRKSIPQGS